MELAIDVRNVKKSYKLYDKPSLRVKEALSLTGKKYHKEFKALRDITFQVKKGEMLGIIGKNGAGKSTLLKIITGVLTPTSGEVKINGKISALLELGAGFNPEYTGIENIYLNGSMIGFTKEEMDAKLDDILTFADIGEFVYQRVKTYSSGMFARLAFAVAINVNPDILIVDEALSVGDVFFQAKCYKKLEDLKNSGKTILFVTHDMGSVIRYCNRAILINDGVIAAEGAPDKIVDLYKKVLVGQFDRKSEEIEDNKKVQDGKDWKSYMLMNPNGQVYGDQRAEIVDFGIFDEKGEISNTVRKMKNFTIKMKVHFNETIENPIFAFSIKTTKGTEVTGTNTIIEEIDTGTVRAGEEIEIEFNQIMRIQGGQYLLNLGCTGYEGDNLVVYNRLYDICCISVISEKTTVGFFDMDTTVKYQKSNK
ncbi:ABC transporter ATP-binding protein [Anaerostipes sp.]|uniref:ABC transporter ATP-binding protein n=1 Tax=Anaerostipes sp. TaxID=1872530 RepID=UPI002583C8CF|nr:ABC transporter ATP-binding protein [Anaerostipes sp.]MCI5623379.1 ABC transporter ATP-binding protein [Anaerostipes sp.]